MVLQVLSSAIYSHHLNLQIKTGNFLKCAVVETEVKCSTQRLLCEILQPVLSSRPAYMAIRILSFCESVYLSVWPFIITKTLSIDGTKMT